MNKKILRISTLLFLGACSSFKEKMGLVHYAPNEFETVQHDPLEIPTHLDLRNPDDPYKQKKSTAERVKSLLVTAPSKAPPTKGAEVEKILLDKIGAEKRDPKIMQRIDKDNQKEPTLNEKIQRTLLFWKKPEKGKVIDPEAEEKKLKSESLS